MRTRRLDAAKAEDLAEAARLLREGGLVSFPTETVYGLGARALEAAAVRRIFAAKGRPAWDPVIVHVAGADEVEALVRLSEVERERFAALAERFWPGPLTMLLPRRPEVVPDEVTAGRERVGVRVPGHAVALALLRAAGVPVAAPSANRFGHTSPTTAEHVLEDLDGRIDAVLDGGPARVGLESTVVDVCETPLRVYRPGAISAEALAQAVGEEVRVWLPASGPSLPEDLPERMASLPSPGVGMRHYAPRARLLLVRDEATIAAMQGDDVGVLLPDGWQAPARAQVFAWGPWDRAEVLAERLFAGLRALDAREVRVIVAPVPVGGGVAVALRDRMEKAARAE